MSDAPPATEAPVRLHLVGSPRLVLADGALHALERKDAALLALLALEGPTPRERASTLLWSEASERRARANLRQRLFRLRRTAGCELVHTSEALRLAPALPTDLADLPRRLARDPAAAHGDLLGVHDYSDTEALAEWVDAARDRWRALRLDALAGVASELEAQRRIAAALPYALRMVAENPLLEHGHRRLMRLHYLRGDRAAALAAFERCCQVLGRELGARAGAETRELAALIERSASPLAARPTRPVAVLRPPRLVGREREWQALTDAPPDSAVLLLGEPGIGKTRLLSEHAQAHSPGIVTGARPGDVGLPYALLARAMRAGVQQFGPPQASWAAAELARVVPGLGAAPAHRIEPLRLQHAVEQVLPQWRGAGLELLALDDLQYADVATLELLPALTAAAGAAGVRCVLAARTAPMPDVVASWLASGSGLRALPIQALGEADVRVLIDSLGVPGLDAASWATPLTRHCGGNPMFLLATLLELHEGDPRSLARAPAALPLPVQVGALIEQRLGQLGAPALRLAHVAAIAGQDFSAELAAGVLGCGVLDLAPAWQALEVAQVLRGESFAHDLIHEATLRTVPPTLARASHGDVARHLEREGGEPSRIADHWLQAGEPARAGAAFLRAAATAFSASQRRLEAELAGAAADCFARSGDAQREFAAREQAFYAARYVERFAQTVQRADILLALAATPAQRAAALQAKATILLEDYQDELLIALAGEARALWRSLGDARREMLVARLEARALSRVQRTDEALRLVDRYAPAARGRDAASAAALGDFGCALMACDRVDDAQRLFDQALDVAQAVQDLGVCQFVHGHRAWAQIYRGDLAAAVASFEAGRALSPNLGSERMPAGLTDAILARHYKELGRFAQALEVFEATLREQRENGDFALLPVCEAELADTWLWLGQPARAQSALGMLPAGAPPGVRRAWLLQRARIARHRGRADTALLDEAHRLAQREGGAIYRAWVELEQVHALPAVEAARLALDALERTASIGLMQMAWPLRALASDALRRAGDTAAAAAHARRLVQEFGGGKPVTVMYAPELWWIVSRALAAAGDTALAAAAVRCAADWIERVALPNVPEPFRDAFIHRQPVNRLVLACSARA